MAAKTFIPRLVQIVRLLCIYMTRYENQIRRNLPEGAVNPFNALAAACTVFLTAVGDLPINP